MDIEVFALCDAATENMGKLNMLGAFDTLIVSGLPAVHPFCAVVLRIRFRRIEQGQHRLVLHLINADGQMVIPPLDGSLGINVPPGEHSSVANLILQLQNIRFESEGEYSFDLAIDGRQVACLPLFVKMKM